MHLSIQLLEGVAWSFFLGVMGVIMYPGGYCTVIFIRNRFFFIVSSFVVVLLEVVLVVLYDDDAKRETLESSLSFLFPCGVAIESFD